MRLMEVHPYDPAWPVAYGEEAARLAETLGEEIVHLHHIGSTAVPGLASKAVIDICLEVRAVERLDAFDEAMRSLGYDPRGENGIPGRRFYAKGGDERTHHVHAFTAGDPHAREHLVFRDYLCAFPGERDAYARRKQRVSREHRTDPEGYVAAKADFVRSMVDRALDWAERRT